MNSKGSLPPDNFDEQVKRARENFQVISELKEKLEILTEHVTSRKEALEEEIEESLHEAIRNANDSLERIQENIDPKLEKVIKEKLDVIEKKMNNWKEDGLEAVRNEIEKQTPEITRKALWELDQTVVEKVKLVKGEILESVREEVGRQTKPTIQELKETLQSQLKRVQAMSLVAVGMSTLLVAVMAWLALN